MTEQDSPSPPSSELYYTVPRAMVSMRAIRQLYVDATTTPDLAQDAMRYYLSNLSRTFTPGGGHAVVAPNRSVTTYHLAIADAQIEESTEGPSLAESIYLGIVDKFELGEHNVRGLAGMRQHAGLAPDLYDDPVPTDTELTNMLGHQHELIRGIKEKQTFFALIEDPAHHAGSMRYEILGYRVDCWYCQCISGRSNDRLITAAAKYTGKDKYDFANDFLRPFGLKTSGGNWPESDTRGTLLLLGECLRVIDLHTGTARVDAIVPPGPKRVVFL